MVKPFPIQLAPGESLLSVWSRRLISIPLMMLLALVAWLAAPICLTASLAVDFVFRPTKRLATTRAVLFFLLYLGCEAIGIVVATFVDVLTLGGRLVSRPRYLHYNAVLQHKWSSALLRGALTIFSMRLQAEGREHAKAGPFILLVRHVSTADTVLAAVLVTKPGELLLKYVMKRELLWDPCLDVVGRRLPNAFIDRAGAHSGAAIDAVVSLGQDLDNGAAVLLYPEGTRFSSSKRIRSIDRLRERGLKDLAAMAEEMQQVLSPRLGGIMSLMDAVPQADLVFLAHTGFEGARTFRAFINGELTGKTVRVALWRVPAREIPPDGRERWLFQRWIEVDSWVQRNCAT